MPKFSANLSFFFPRTQFLGRYKLAKEAGFQAVEGSIPLNIKLDEVVDAKKQAGVEQIHMDAFRGDEEKGEFGFAALPGKENEYKRTLEKSLEFAKALDVKILHIAAGYVNEAVTSKHFETYKKNLSETVPYLKEANIIGVLEPITRNTRPLYFLNNVETAISIIEEINSPYLKLELDIFHAQQIRGDLTNIIKKNIKNIAHVQIAQVPNRNEPDTLGELNYKYLIDLLENQNYKGFIGLEYQPIGDTVKGLKWIKDFVTRLLRNHKLKVLKYRLKELHVKNISAISPIYGKWLQWTVRTMETIYLMPSMENINSSILW